MSSEDSFVKEFRFRKSVSWMPPGKTFPEEELYSVPRWALRSHQPPYTPALAKPFRRAPPNRKVRHVILAREAEVQPGGALDAIVGHVVDIL